ncbi:hypothetical protein JCM10207_005853 [Rhodosporidiobolus poonsookiae]
MGKEVLNEHWIARLERDRESYLAHRVAQASIEVDNRARARADSLLRHRTPAQALALAEREYTAAPEGIHKTFHLLVYRWVYLRVHDRWPDGPQESLSKHRRVAYNERYWPTARRNIEW